MFSTKASNTPSALSCRWSASCPYDSEDSDCGTRLSRAYFDSPPLMKRKRLPMPADVPGKPGMLFVNRYLPDASPEEKEDAYQNVKDLIAVLVRINARLRTQPSEECTRFTLTPSTPEAHHRRKRRWIESQLLYFSGTLRQGALARNRHRIPLMMLRISSGGRPRPCCRPPAPPATKPSMPTIPLPSDRRDSKLPPRLRSLESIRDSRVNEFVHAD